MFEEPKPMQEIHRIQKSISEKEKSLSPKQRIRKLHKEATEIIKKYGLKTKHASKV